MTSPVDDCMNARILAIANGLPAGADALKFIVLALMSVLPGLGVAAQQELQAAASEEPEEIVVTGERSALQLRIQMEAAEKLAYETFNKFNDEARFDISCSVSERTGSRFKQQVCQPEFELQALRGHAQDFLDSMPGRNIGLPDGSVSQAHQPMATEILKQRPAFQQKMKEIAEQHPEFLEALANFARLQEEYRQRR